MGSIGTDLEFDHLRDVLGNMTMMKTYTVTCLCFRLEDESSTDDVVSTLTDGLDTLAKRLPYLKGKVIYEGLGEGSTGTSRIVYLADSINLIVKDIRQEATAPNFEELRQANYPASMLDGNLLCPRPGMPLSYQDSEEKPAPVLVAQANFIKGGLLLSFAGHHAIMDMNGLGQIICLFSKACRSEAFDETEIKEGNRSRIDAIELLGDSYEPGPEIDDIWAQTPPTHDPNAAVPVWAYFNFSVESQKKLKQKAQVQEVVPYISTNDAITAFVWQHIARARKEHLGTDIDYQVGRAADGRGPVGLDRHYLGHMVQCVTNKETDVWKYPLGDVAGRLRKALQDPGNAKRIRAMATMLDRTPDKSKIVYGANLRFDRDIMMSSWAQIPCCQLSYGELLGVPEAARRPRMAPFGSIVYLMPRDKHGDVAGAFCLIEDELRWLGENPSFCEFAEYVG